MDGRALVEQQEQWTADRRFIFLFPSSRALRSCRAPREISRSPRLAHKAPVMQAIRLQVLKPIAKNKEKRAPDCRLTHNQNVGKAATFTSLSLLPPPLAQC